MLLIIDVIKPYLLDLHWPASLPGHSYNVVLTLFISNINYAAYQFLSVNQ